MLGAIKREMCIWKLDNDTSVTKLARHYCGEVRFLCALAKQLIDEAIHQNLIVISIKMLVRIRQF